MVACTLDQSCTTAVGSLALGQFLVLLVVHWFADFVLQTHWQASNKSKNNAALGAHVLTYTGCLALATWFLFGPTWSSVGFVAVNGALHFTTDWCTSRASSRLFMEQLDAVHVSGVGYRMALKEKFTFHWFFVVLGFDQLTHQLTLAGTMMIIFGGP